ncbi:hypothetical protein OG742_22620 [Streptomyces sp. NBC_00828]|uniref:hypothetical protein n=1 Tax=Streptomyces sp. NBC_00828 TaxID=2903678 RepID=UPI00386D00CD
MEDEPITERRSVAGPHVFGYVRHITGGLARHAALVDCLTEYCRRHELTLCGVFTDREPTVAIRSPAFVGLLDTLELPDAYGAVLPARSHLGPRRIATERERQIVVTSTRLLVVRSMAPRSSHGSTADTNSIGRLSGGI